MIKLFIAPNRGLLTVGSFYLKRLKGSFLKGTLIENDNYVKVLEA